MAPESPGNLVALDLEWRNSRLECQVDRYDPTGEEFLHVSWNAIECPEDYVPVGSGVAYVWVPLNFEHRRYRARIDKANGGFEWLDKAFGIGLMLILTLPPTCTYIFPDKGKAGPWPIRFKSTNDRRMALYWWLQGQSPHGRAVVSWQIQCDPTVDIEAQCDLLNEEARRMHAHPVHIDLPPGGAVTPSAQPPILGEPPSWHIKNAIIIGAMDMSKDKIQVSNVVGPVNINSQLDRVTQIVKAAPAMADSKRQQLAELIGELQEALKGAAEKRPDDAQRVTRTVELVATEVVKHKPDKGFLSITGEGLKQAAKAVEDVAPAVIGVAAKIASFIAGL
jgi:hypothetical protein